MKFSKYNIIHTTENQEHILFNSLWGSTFVISPSVKQAIESSNPTLLTEEENRLFIKYNALIPDEYNESCIYNHFYNKSRYGKKCLTATVLLTWSCNFRCIYCYEGAGELRCENMTKNRAGAIANFLIKCSEEQRGELIHVVLFGGEPLLNIDVGFHMLGILKEYCLTSHKELQCSLVTNGSLLTEEIVSGLLNYNCKFVQITLDGPEYIHNCRRVAKDGSGTFQKVLHVVFEGYIEPLALCLGEDPIASTRHDVAVSVDKLHVGDVTDDRIIEVDIHPRVGAADDFSEGLHRLRLSVQGKGCVIDGVDEPLPNLLDADVCERFCHLVASSSHLSCAGASGRIGTPQIFLDAALSPGDRRDVRGEPLVDCIVTEVIELLRRRECAGLRELDVAGVFSALCRDLRCEQVTLADHMGPNATNELTAPWIV